MTFSTEYALSMSRRITRFFGAMKRARRDDRGIDLFFRIEASNACQGARERFLDEELPRIANTRAPPSRIPSTKIDIDSSKRVRTRHAAERATALMDGEDSRRVIADRTWRLPTPPTALAPARAPHADKPSV